MPPVRLTDGSSSSGGGAEDPGTLDGDEGLWGADIANTLENATLRQFDDSDGGGFADEAAAVVDPTRGASATTEQTLRDDDVQTAASLIPVFGMTINSARGTLGLSDTVDEVAGTTPPDEQIETPATTPEGDNRLFSGDPVGGATEITVDAVEDARDAANDAAQNALGINADTLVMVALAGVALYLLNPVLTVVANLTGE